MRKGRKQEKWKARKRGEKQVKNTITHAPIHFFFQVPFIIFLNKVDLFRSKIVEFPLSDVFKNYPKGKSDDLEDAYESGIGYVNVHLINLDNQQPTQQPTTTKK